MTKYFITQEPTSYQPISIPKVEEKYGAKFVGDFCVKTKSGGWSEEPIAIFYQPNPNVALGHKHYFGLFVRGESMYITDGTSAFSEPIVGIVTPGGEVIFSRYRHDFVEREGVFIDGGRDYVHIGGNIAGVERVHVVPDGAVLKVVPIPADEQVSSSPPSIDHVYFPKTHMNEWTDGPSFIVDLDGVYADLPNAHVFENTFDATVFIVTSPENATFKVSGTVAEVEELATRFPTRDIRHLSL
jgi:hypothetical protein